jgi:MFS family permease
MLAVCEARQAHSSMHILPPSASPDSALLLTAKGLRATADGFVSVILPAYLLLLGFGPLQIGLLATVALAGSAVVTLAVGHLRLGLTARGMLLLASGLMAVTGLAFATLGSFWVLLAVAFLGPLNPSAGDVSMFLPLEHSLLAGSVSGRDRTALFSRYSLIGSLMGGAGSLLAAVPDLVVHHVGLTPLRAFQSMFLAYAAIGAASGFVYRALSPADRGAATVKRQPLGASRRHVYGLAALFGVDAFGGGLFVQSILALWLFQRFGLSVTAAAQIFFWTNLLSAFSFLAAAPLAQRIGLVNTMVFTHLPSNLCLVLIPFMPDVQWSLALLMLRSLLSQMDVPTRSSYVMAIVAPAERAAAASITSVPRGLASALGPVLAGYMLSLAAFGWPLVIGGLLKIGYDLSLYSLFRKVRPPEERDD